MLRRSFLTLCGLVPLAARLGFPKSKLEHKNKHIVLYYNDYVGLIATKVILPSKQLASQSFEKQRTGIFKSFEKLGWDDGIVISNDNGKTLLGYKSLTDLTKFLYKNKLMNWSIAYYV